MGCANISTPSGGKRDKTPPKLLAVTPKDSLLNTRIWEMRLQFDEYVTVSDVQKEVEISPMLPVPPIVTATGKHVKFKIEDSLLEANTTYRISFGKAIKDVHEGNAFTGYTYTFSTGNYFDSLELTGSVQNAMTGMTDTTDVVVVLYNADEDDSAVVKKKPRYKTRPNASGTFSFTGLPAKPFRIYAIKDGNTNMIYDGGGEKVAFCDSLLTPTDSFAHPVTLRLFAEKADTAVVAKTDTEPSKKGGARDREKAPTKATVDTTFTYTTNLDTSSSIRRTFDLNDTIKLSFNKIPALYAEQLSLTYDSAGQRKNVAIQVAPAATEKYIVYIIGKLKENTLYTLRMQEGFAADTTGRRTVAARYGFRTFNDDDYGKIKLNIPARYTPAPGRPAHLLAVVADDKELYARKITDSVMALTRLRPGKYTFRIIVDRNGNGKWDTGDLLAKEQPELVIPSTASVPLKAGYDHTLDLETDPTKGKDPKNKRTGK
ncbi:hypothetical protein GCM10023093_26990 [Nemorincola caseinilytica]|uniref:SbsA Ig-like domain-containing protein n=2 Tax=Nemorincola caseinilytica TaxID=2054315 RepID=A0ABP8NPM0_9BACT